MVVGCVHLWGSLGVQACWQGVSREKPGCRAAAFGGFGNFCGQRLEGCLH